MSRLKNWQSNMSTYGVQIIRKDGHRFLASNVGAYVAMFNVFADAQRFAKELREELPKGLRIRVVRVLAQFKWTA